MVGQADNSGNVESELGGYMNMAICSNCASLLVLCDPWNHQEAVFLFQFVCVVVCKITVMPSDYLLWFPQSCTNGFDSIKSHLREEGACYKHSDRWYRDSLTLISICAIVFIVHLLQYLTQHFRSVDHNSHLVGDLYASFLNPLVCADEPCDTIVRLAHVTASATETIVSH